MQRIMLATDFSERSDRAFRRAVILARQHGAALDIVHVVDDDRPRRIVDHEMADARLLLAELARSLTDLDGLACSTQVVLDDPFAGIASAAAKAAPELLVIGPHRRQILRDAFVGTTAERTIRAVQCPVLMVNGPPVGPWRHLLLATDMSDHAAAALKRLAELGLAGGARASVLNVFEAPALRLAMSDSMSEEGQQAYLDDLHREAGQELGAFLAQAGFGEAERILRQNQTSVANEILRTEEEIKADLIVVSTQGRGAVARMVLGSVAQRVLKDAQADVLAIPAEPA